MKDRLLVVCLVLADFAAGFLVSDYPLFTGNVIKQPIVPGTNESNVIPAIIPPISTVQSSPSQSPIPSPESCIVQKSANPPTGYSAIVSKVVDGDTIDIQDGQRVRLLGINTPEKAQPYFEEATARMKELVLGKTAILVMDKSDKDKYGRLLRHVYVDGVNAGEVMLSEGYANAFFISPDLGQKEEFERAEECARTQGVGIWNTSNYTDCIGIAYFEYNAPGDDRYNLNGEYVKFKNSCDFAISLKGWSVKDEATHIYEFPTFVLSPQQMVTLFTGSGSNSADSLYWGQSSSVWNNDGDTLYMWDSEGKMIIRWRYEGFQNTG